MVSRVSQQSGVADNCGEDAVARDAIPAMADDGEPLARV